MSSVGAGKSSLVTAPLWALTGDMLTRTESGSGRATGTVDSMLNDDSKLARVVLRGTVNGVSFVVERAVSVRLVTGKNLYECLLHSCILPAGTAKQWIGMIALAHQQGTAHATQNPMQLMLTSTYSARLSNISATVRNISATYQQHISNSQQHKGATSKKKAQTSKLSLILDGKDHTQQTIRLTQASRLFS
eukprot:1161947-Pelagomonas_calceolata.AAC.7